VSALGDAERGALVALARAAIRHHLGAGPAPEIPTGGILGAPQGAFVTLRRRGDGELRGCIGTLAAREPLAAAVARLAVAAATEDPRFPPVDDAAELDELAISISVLAPLRRIAGPEDVVVGRDGVVIQLGWHRGTLLPVVAVEHGWTAEELVRHTCLKANLPPDAWRDPKAVLEAFSAEELGE
jgi:AmmeMemoRadiSam system protein A